MSAARYVWSHPYGRLAVLTIAATVLLILAQVLSVILCARLGLSPGFPPAFGWPPYLLLAGLHLPRGQVTRQATTGARRRYPTGRR